MRKRVDVFLFSLTESVNKLRVNSDLAKMTAFPVGVMSEPGPFPPLYSRCGCQPLIGSLHAVNIPVRGCNQVDRVRVDLIRT